MGVSLVYSTWPDIASARAAARIAVDERLCACANIWAPLESVYRWEDVVEKADEIPVLFKTTDEAAPMLIERLKRLHPYEIPCLIGWRADEGASHSPFTNWVQEQIGKT